MWELRFYYHNWNEMTFPNEVRHIRSLSPEYNPDVRVYVNFGGEIFHVIDTCLDEVDDYHLERHIYKAIEKALDDWKNF